MKYDTRCTEAPSPYTLDCWEVFVIYLFSFHSTLLTPVNTHHLTWTPRANHFTACTLKINSNNLLLFATCTTKFVSMFDNFVPKTVKCTQVNKNTHRNQTHSPCHQFALSCNTFTHLSCLFSSKTHLNKRLPLFGSQMILYCDRDTRVQKKKCSCS